ncbi:MAG: hypothetical protein DMG04_00235 [Acidobacteria bacterium]|nr:MAG: hypothetical protein DMG04_00235 [Acidobacteriota bacterium]PYQ86136.1 MAG: hypothetical protein DMG02_25410 [Acidobacteriota bacterium]PYQ87538.1 MAG: hypothetical protein DMG03_05335 [Acidobacteriota bacterium]
MRSSHGARRHRRRRKTTALAAVRDAAEREGYQVEGFAPTSRATHKLAEVGIESNTLQRQQDARHRGWRLRPCRAHRREEEPGDGQNGRRAYGELRPPTPAGRHDLSRNGVGLIRFSGRFR